MAPGGRSREWIGGSEAPGAGLGAPGRAISASKKVTLGQMLPGVCACVGGDWGVERGRGFSYGSPRFPGLLSFSEPCGPPLKSSAQE